MVRPIPSWALVKREFVVYLRTARPFWIVSLFVAVCIWMVVALWPRDFYSAVPSRFMLNAFTLIYGGACCLFLPGLAAVTFTVEKERETYDQLLLTLIRPSGILFGKLINVLGFYYLMLLASLPVMGVVLFLVGIEASQLLSIFGMASAVAFSCTAAGILCSTVARRSYTSIILSYLAMFALMGAVVGLAAAGFAAVDDMYWGAYGVHFIDPDTLLPLLFILSPPAAIIATIGGVTWAGGLWLTGLVQVLLGAAALGLAAQRLRRAAEPPRVAQDAPIDDAAILRERRRHFPYYLIDPLKRRKPIEDGRNPMLVKELRWGFLGRATRFIRLFFACVILYFIVFLFMAFTGAFSRSSWEGITIFAFLQMILPCVFAPAMMANALSKEHELGNMDALRMTLLSPAQIVLGKLGAGYAGVAPMLLASAVASAPLLFIAPVTRSLEGGAALCGLISLALNVTLALSIGLYCSMRTNHTSTAILLSYFVCTVVFGGLVLAVAVAFESFNVPQRQPLEQIVCFLSPVVAYVYNGVDLARRGKTAFTGFYLLNVFVYGTIAALLVRGAVVGFKHRYVYPLVEEGTEWPPLWRFLITLFAIALAAPLLWPQLGAATFALWWTVFALLAISVFALRRTQTRRLDKLLAVIYAALAIYPAFWFVRWSAHGGWFDVQSWPGIRILTDIVCYGASAVLLLRGCREKYALAVVLGIAAVMDGLTRVLLRIASGELNVVVNLVWQSLHDALRDPWAAVVWHPFIAVHALVAYYALCGRGRALTREKTLTPGGEERSQMA